MLCLLLALPNGAIAQTTAFTVVDSQKQTHTIPYTVINIDGLDYLSLPDLIQSLGGAHTIISNRVRVDLEGTTAWVSLNDNRVNALSYFSLTHNVVSNDKGIFISRLDCPVFFKKAFRIDLFSSNAAVDPKMSQSPLGDNMPNLLENIPSIPESVESRSATLRTILLDPGHGGYESGLSDSSGLAEKEIVLSIAKRVQEKLAGNKSVTIVLSRDQDISLSNQQRASIFREKKADLLITLHVGGSFSEAMNGIAFFYPTAPKRKPNTITMGKQRMSYAASSRMIARQLSTHLLEETAAMDRGLHAIPNPLFGAINAPSCLIELGCLSNANDAVALGDEAYRDKVAQGIVSGILALVDNTVATDTPETLSNESFSESTILTEAPEAEFAP